MKLVEELSNRMDDDIELAEEEEETSFFQEADELEEKRESFLPAVLALADEQVNTTSTATKAPSFRKILQAQLKDHE